MTPYSRMGDDRSAVEDGIEETLQQAVDLRKSEYNRQLDAKGVKPCEEPEPSQPLPSVPSESEPEEHPYGNVENITYAEKGQFLHEVAAGRGPWSGLPTAVKCKDTEKKMKDLHLRLSQQTGLDAAPKQQALFANQFLPRIPEEDKLIASLSSNIPDELGVPVAGARISGMKLPRFQPATVAVSDIAPQGRTKMTPTETTTLESS